MDISTSTKTQQAKTVILEYIQKNHLKRNDQLPSEGAIAKILGVSRNTLREAYIMLENEGIILRRHGIGTFIAKPPMIQDSLNEFSPFAQIIRKGGFIPSSEVLSVEIVQPEARISDVFGIDASEKIRRIKRLVKADEQTAIFVDDYISPLVQHIDVDWSDFNGNMVQLLGSSLKTPLHQIQSKIRAGALSSEISQYFELPEGTPVLSVRSTIYTVR